MSAKYGKTLSSKWVQFRDRHTVAQLADHDMKFVRDCMIGVEAVERALNGNWWDWTDGSTLMLWRWTRSEMKWIRDGLPIHCADKLPKYWATQLWPADANYRNQMQAKIAKIVERRYISVGKVLSLTGFFCVLKGD